jgi:hypothetical protein
MPAEPEGSQIQPRAADNFETIRSRGQFDLTDEETFTLRKLLTDPIEQDRYPLSPAFAVVENARAEQASQTTAQTASA